MKSPQTRGYPAPTHVSSISLKNFRGFQSSPDVPLRPLTFLVGPNSSGKSSLAYALMLLAQSEIMAFGSLAPDWSGPLVDLGSFEDVVFRHNDKIRISITATFSRLQRFVWGKGLLRTRLPPISITAEFHATNGPVGAVSRLDIKDVISGHTCHVVRRPGRYASYQLTFNSATETWKPDPRSPVADFGSLLYVFLERASKGKGPRGHVAAAKRLRASIFSIRMFGVDIQRVPSGRQGPKRWYDRRSSVEYDFERSPTWDRVEPALLGAKAFEHAIVAERLNQALVKLGICSELSVADMSAYHTSIQVHDHVANVDANLSDVGFGLSQVFPVVRAATTDARALLHIEQPEVHLHPKAQSDLGELLALLSRTRQVIVETHSEHLINRARILVAEGKLSSKQVTILYVDRSSKGSKVTVIELDRLGNFSREWPKGFFEERYKDTMRLAEIQGAAKRSQHGRRA